MIRKNQDYGSVENVTIAEFGLGTIGIVGGVNAQNGDVSILMKTDKKADIGSDREVCSNSDEFKPELALVFRNKASFDVFFGIVQRAKTFFEE